MVFERLFADVSPEVARVLEAALDGCELSTAEAALLLEVQGPDLLALMRAADFTRRKDKGDRVSFVVNRNINFTNICQVGCSFCGFSRQKDAEDAYDHSLEVLVEKARSAQACGATEVCIQGGIHPDKDHTDYHAILTAISRELPALHIHAFSPEEIDFGQRKSGMELADYLRWLVEAGLGSMPGTAAEILDDEVRRVVAPRKLKKQRWVEIVTAAHGIGLRSSSTIMYGHIESPRHVAEHLTLLREIQKRTGGFTEFVPLGFIHERNILYQPPRSARRLFDARGRPARGGGPSLPAALDHERPGFLGEDGAQARPDGADGGGQRPGRHADGGVDQPRVGLGVRREPARRGDAAPDPRDWPHTGRAQHHLRDPAPLRRSGA